MKVFGIESSCDETAIAIVDENRVIHSHVIASQIEQHAKYGGVVPEIASRNHLSQLEALYNNTNFSSIDAIAVTAGPGLIGGLIVGVMFAKGLSIAYNKPIIAINHLEAHALTPRLSDPNLDFPYLMLLVSGGHCQILEVLEVGEYKLIGKTIDDAVGEAFDKVAKMLNLPYPGGPIIEQMAKDGNENAIRFPVPLLKTSLYDFTFSGLKTSVRRYIELNPNPAAQHIRDICASFQKAVSAVLVDRMRNAAKQFNQKYTGNKKIVIAGGVAANQYIKRQMESLGYEVVTPPIKLCTDNGAMIAWAGVERLKRGLVDNLDFEPRARWQLEKTE